MKKVIAIILILIGAILLLAILAGLPETIIIFVRTIKSNTPESWGYLLGSLSTTVILTGIVFILFWFGIKWIKK